MMRLARHFGLIGLTILALDLGNAQIIYRPISGAEASLQYLTNNFSPIGHTHGAHAIVTGTVDVLRYHAYSNLVYWSAIGTNAAQVAPGIHQHDLSDMIGTLSAERYRAYDSLLFWLDIGDGTNQVAAGDHVHATYEDRMTDIEGSVGIVSNMVLLETGRATEAELGLTTYINNHVATNAGEHGALSVRIGGMEGRTSVWNTVTGKVDQSAYDVKVEDLESDIATNAIHIWALRQETNSYVKTNDVRQLDFTGADVRIADSTYSNNPVTRSEIDTLRNEAFSVTDFYYNTNAHPDIAGAGVLQTDIPDACEFPTGELLEGTNSLYTFWTTNVTTRIRGDVYESICHALRTSGNSASYSRFELLYTDDAGATTNVLATGQSGDNITGALKPYSTFKGFNGDITGTNLLLGVRLSVVRASGGSGAEITFYGGIGYPSHLATPGIGDVSGYVTTADFAGHTNNESADIQHLTAAEKLLATNSIQGATIVTGEVASVETNAGILAITVPSGSGGAGTITNILSTDGSIVITDPGGPQPDLSITNYVLNRGYLTNVAYGITDSTAYRGDHGTAASNLAYAASTNAEAARVIATNAQTIASAALPKAGGTMTGNINMGAKALTNASLVQATTGTFSGSLTLNGNTVLTNAASGLTEAQVKALAPLMTNSESVVLGKGAYIDDAFAAYGAAVGMHANSVGGWVMGLSATGAVQSAVYGNYAMAEAQGSAFGDGSSATTNSVALGRSVVNTIPNSTLVKGTLYTTNGAVISGGNLNMSAQSLTNATNVSAHSFAMTGGNFDGGGGAVTNVSDVIGSGIVAGTTPGWSLYTGANRVLTNAALTILGYDTIVSSNRAVFTPSSFSVAPQVEGWYMISVNPYIVGGAAGVNRWAVMGIYKNEGDIAWMSFLSFQTGSDGDYRPALTTIAYANGSSDYFDARVYNGFGVNITNTPAGNFNFQGRFIGK